MDLAQTFSVLATQLDRAIEAFESETISPGDASTLRLATTALQYQLDALAMKVETKIESDGSNITYLGRSTSDAPSATELIVSGETAAYSTAPFAVGTAAASVGPSSEASDPVLSKWEDGTEFEWVGSQCIVHRGNGYRSSDHRSSDHRATA